MEGVVSSGAWLCIGAWQGLKAIDVRGEDWSLADCEQRIGSGSMAEMDSYRLQYEQWVRSFAPQLYRYAYRMTGRHAVAEDLVQETFMEAWRSIASQRDESRARGWLFQILRHRYAHFVRDRGRNGQPVALGEHSRAASTGAIRHPLEALAEKDALQTAMDTLSPVIRETFLMVFVEQCTCRETAESLHIPLGTVLSRLDSARRALRAALGEPPKSGRDETLEDQHGGRVA
jgi:RNA polymerase sigma-70 factor, ECF subfamily